MTQFKPMLYSLSSWGTLSSRGGAALHAEILRAASSRAGLEDVHVVGPSVPVDALASPFHPGYTHTFASIRRFPREALGAADDCSWRVAQFLGTNPVRGGSIVAKQQVPQAVDTLMIVDHALGFRHHPVGLPELLAAHPHTIVWKTGAPLAGSVLADTLLGEHADELTVITSSDELRKTGEQVGYALSWEQLTEEILVAVRASPV